MSMTLEIKKLQSAKFTKFFKSRIVLNAHAYVNGSTRPNKLPAGLGKINYATCWFFSRQ